MTNQTNAVVATIIGQFAGVAIGAFINHAKAVKRAGGVRVVKARETVANETKAHNRNVMIRCVTKANLPVLSANQELAVMNLMKIKFRALHTDSTCGVDAIRTAKALEEAFSFLDLGTVAIAKHLPPRADRAVIAFEDLPAILSAAGSRM